MTVTLANPMPPPQHPSSMLPLLKRHEIQVMAKTGLPLVRIAELSGVPKRSVQRVLDEPFVEHVDDHAEHKRRGIGRPSVAEPFRERLIAWLQERPDLPSLELLRRAKLDGYQGGKTALYRLAATLRPKTAPPLIRFEGLAGEFSQHDFGEVDVHFLDGRCQRIHFFASRLKFSRWAEVSLVPNQTAESLVRALVEHFARWGGLPMLAVFDRPKTIAIRWTDDGVVTEWNSQFSQVVLELGLGVELCWPYRPNQKGSIENLVGWVKGSFFKIRKFHDEQDLREQLREWLHEANTLRPCRATQQIPAVRFEAEKSRLRPLRVAPDQLALRAACVVNPEGYVVHDGVRYSMPFESRHQRGTLYLLPQRVRLIVGVHRAEHPRLFEPGTQAPLPEDRQKVIEAAVGKRAKIYAKRQHLLALGPTVEDFLTELIHRCPDTWPAHVDRLFEELQKQGSDVLLRAIKNALEQQVFGAEYVVRFLPTSCSLPPGRESSRPGDEEPPRGTTTVRASQGSRRAEPRRRS